MERQIFRNDSGQSFRNQQHFSIARNSLGEVVAAIDLAEATGALSATKAAELLQLAGRLHPLVCGLLKR